MAAAWLRACAYVLLIAAPFVARADAPASVFLEDLTSPELAARLRAGTTTSSFRSAAPSRTARTWRSASTTSACGSSPSASRARSATPVVAPGDRLRARRQRQPADGAYALSGQPHRSRPDVYRAVDRVRQREASSSAGFRDIVVLGDSGDYQKDNATVAAKLDKEWAATPVRVHAVNEYYRAATSEFFDSLRRQGFKEGEIGPHAGLADTSLMLAVDPGSSARTACRRATA
jgi:hypothetical protein